MYPGAYTVSLYRFPNRPEVLPPSRSWIPGGTAVGDVRAYGRASASLVVRPFSSLARACQRYFYTYGPLFGLILITGLAGLVRRWRQLGGAGLLPWAVAVTLLLFPIATADVGYRYLLAVLPFASLTAALAFAPGEVEQLPHETLTAWRVAQASPVRPSRSGGSS